MSGRQQGMMQYILRREMMGNTYFTIIEMASSYLPVSPRQVEMRRHPLTGRKYEDTKISLTTSSMIIPNISPPHSRLVVLCPTQSMSSKVGTTSTLDRQMGTHDLTDAFDSRHSMQPSSFIQASQVLRLFLTNKSPEQGAFIYHITTNSHLGGLCANSARISATLPR